jgi:menaquinol-cytochrome c reductase iron-sulfur subunit
MEQEQRVVDFPSPAPLRIDPRPPEPRRGFLLRIGIGLSALAAILGSVPVLGYLLSPLRTAGERKWVRLGPVSDFPVGETRLTTFQNPSYQAWDGPTAMVPCYVRRVASDRFQVFAVNCTHLGCPVRWFPESGLFMCPCHGGVYYDNGARASGPPPRGLFEYQWQLRRGELWVRGGVLPTLATPA